MNTLNFLDPLLSVASHGETRASHRRSFWTGIKSEYLLPDFFSLAGKAVPGANTGLEQALSAFFKPEVVRFLAKVGKEVADDNVVNAGGDNTPAQTAAQRLFG